MTYVSTSQIKDEKSRLGDRFFYKMGVEVFKIEQGSHKERRSWTT